LIDRHNFDQWMANGGGSMRERARKKIDEVLSEEPQDGLPPDIKRRISSITENVIETQS